MQRKVLTPRPDWITKVESLGLIWHSAGGAPYWDESACYVMSDADIAALTEATATLYGMFLEAGQYIIDNNLFDHFDIPNWCRPLITSAWKDEVPALNYGRFDLGYDGRSSPKLFEFNCDKPTSLVEAAVVQWFWKEEVFPSAGQFNDLHDLLIAKWADLKPYLTSETVHFGHIRDYAGEDQLTTAYMMDLAGAAGLKTQAIAMPDIGWAKAKDLPHGGFFDLQNQEIRTLYKLYPWEWMVAESFGPAIAENMGRARFIEPIWKMIWSHKAILAVLWDLFPRHPNLLWARLDAPVSDSYVKKPVLGREGGNVAVIRQGKTEARRDGPYSGQCVYQGLYELPEFNGNYPVIGAWIVDGTPAGIGIREDGLVTSNLARFVPHIISN